LNGVKLLNEYAVQQETPDEIDVHFVYDVQGHYRRSHHLDRILDSNCDERSGLEMEVARQFRHHALVELEEYGEYCFLEDHDGELLEVQALFEVVAGFPPFPHRCRRHYHRVLKKPKKTTMTTNRMILDKRFLEDEKNVLVVSWEME
jgi:hypothetical protein